MNYTELFVGALVTAFAGAMVAGIVTLIKQVSGLRIQVAVLTQKLDDHLNDTKKFFKRGMAALLLLACLLFAGCATGSSFPFSRSTNTTETASSIAIAVDPAVKKALETARAVNASLPTPAAPFIELGLGGLAAVLGWIARLKTVKANQQTSLLNATIAGVELAGHADTKAAIEKMSKAAGVAGELHAQVQQVTR